MALLRVAVSRWMLSSLKFGGSAVAKFRLPDLSGS